MTAELIATLLVKYGIPFTDYLVKLWSEKKLVGPDEWAKLLTLVPTPETVLQQIATAAGVGMDDPRIVALAELIKPKAA